MKNATIITLAAAFALASGAGAGVSASPAIRFVDLTPAKVRGTHFGARELVKVTLWAGSISRVRTTRASTIGSFMVDFGTLDSKDRCSGSVSLLATGARGHTARYKLPAMMCPMESPNGA